MLQSAANCVHGQTKLIDEFLSWTSETLSLLTTNFNAPLTTDVKIADSQVKQHNVSTTQYTLMYTVQALIQIS